MFYAVSLNEPLKRPIDEAVNNIRFSVLRLFHPMSNWHLHGWETFAFLERYRISSRQLYTAYTCIKTYIEAFLWENMFLRPFKNSPIWSHCPIAKSFVGKYTELRKRWYYYPHLKVNSTEHYNDPDILIGKCALRLPSTSCTKYHHSFFLGIVY